MVSWLWKITALQGAFIFKRQNWWCFGVATWECSTLSLFPLFSPCCNHCHTKVQEKSKVTDLCKIIEFWTSQRLIKEKLIQFEKELKWNLFHWKLWEDGIFASELEWRYFTDVKRVVQRWNFLKNNNFWNL